MSIAQSVVDIVQEEMARHGVAQLKSINLVVGKLSAIVSEHLIFCFEMITKNSDLDGAMLNIREVPLEYQCVTCENQFFSEEIALTCPRCKGDSLILIGGRELKIEDIEVAD
ncbi:MAG: hydrogenase maturation nickel metallochaperone HypA [Thermodesulfobacteriota bacterium]|nr:hydrogenase maturation nickel metallochaperone HypA [Thermodesulfobacteriota bacterium]